MSIASSSSLVLLRRFRDPSKLGLLSRSRCFPCRKIDDLHYGISAPRVGFSGKPRESIWQASSNSSDILGSSSMASDQDADSIPMPTVLIDQDSDPNATIVQLSFGYCWEALINVMESLKDLGLEVSKGMISTEDSVVQTKFFIRQQVAIRKIEDPDLLERICPTIINNLLKYQPESRENMAKGGVYFGKLAREKKESGENMAVGGEYFGKLAPEKKVETHINVTDDEFNRSLVSIETADRPGIWLEILKHLADMSISVESAEMDTEGLVAKGKFVVIFGGEDLGLAISLAVGNMMRFYLPIR